jgi:pimeloyl-ACP methyl ester carboxylesterase
VLLHAGVADRTMWAEHLRPVAAAGHRVVAMDLPGFGEAPVTSPLAQWTDVLETMDALGIDRAALVGNSFGGMVATRVAAVAPERVTRLMLVSSVRDVEAPSERLRAAWDAENAALEREDIEAAVAAVVEAWTLPDAPRQLRERVAAMQRRALEVQMAAGDVPEADDPLDTLAMPDIPTLVTAGEHDMSDFHAPGAKLISGAGHLAPLEQPEAFRALLLDFLRT